MKNHNHKINDKNSSVTYEFSNIKFIFIDLRTLRRSKRRVKKKKNDLMKLVFNSSVCNKQLKNCTRYVFCVTFNSRWSRTRTILHLRSILLWFYSLFIESIWNQSMPLILFISIIWKKKSNLLTTSCLLLIKLIQIRIRIHLLK